MMLSMAFQEWSRTICQGMHRGVAPRLSLTVVVEGDLQRSDIVVNPGVGSATEMLFPDGPVDIRWHCRKARCRKCHYLQLRLGAIYSRMGQTEKDSKRSILEIPPAG